MQAFKNKQSVKTKYVNRVLEHQKADEIIQGVYWRKGKGCAVGCTMETSENVHEEMERALGVPTELAHLEDTIFECLSNGEAKKFPLRFLKAIPVGADLSLITAKFMVWQFEDKKYGLKNIKEVKNDKEIYGFCEDVVALYKRKIAGDTPTQKEFEDLYLKMAWARAGVSWARAGAWAGAWAWAGDETPYWNAMADKLIELLAEATPETKRREL